MKFYFKLLMGLISFVNTYFGKLKWRERSCSEKVDVWF